MRWVPVMNYFADLRQQFILGHLKTVGQIRRQALIDEFGISTPQASNDIQAFMAAHPGLIIYDGRAKCYILDKEAL